MESIMDLDDEKFEVDDEDLNEGDDEDEGEDQAEEDDDGDEEGDGEGQDEGSEDEDEEGQRVLESGSRANNRIRALNTARKEAEADKLRMANEKSDLQRQLDDLKRQSSSNNNAAERAAYLASLSPEERVLQEARDAQVANQYQIRMLEFKMHDTADKNAFAAKAAVNDVYKRFESQVEDVIAKAAREQGMWFPREEVLANLIGHMVLKNKLKPASKSAAKQNVKKNTVKSGSSRSDVSGARTKGNSAGDRNKRLSEARF